MSLGQIEMGRVTTEVTIENLFDLNAVREGKLADKDVRRIIVADALVDTGATLFSMPRRLIRQLGLHQFSSRRVTTSAGVVDTGLYQAVRLTIQGRSCHMDVLEVPDEVPVLIGQLPLEALDFVVNPSARTLTGNPAHGGEHILELY